MSFDRFTRSSQARAGRGSGLGLAIVQVVANAPGGVAFASNRPKAEPTSGSPCRSGRSECPAIIRRRRTARFVPFSDENLFRKAGRIQRDWYIVDAEGKTLGRLATQIADTLRGKNKPQYTPHVDTGDFVVVINAEKIHVTGQKLDQKMVYRHSGFPGGLKTRTLREQLQRRPSRGDPQSGQGHASEEQARGSSARQAQGLCGARAPALQLRQPQAAGRGLAHMAEDRPVPRHRQAEDLRRPRDPPSRRREDVDQRPLARGVLRKAVASQDGRLAARDRGCSRHVRPSRSRTRWWGVERPGRRDPPRHRSCAGRGRSRAAGPAQATGLSDA